MLAQTRQTRVRAHQIFDAALFALALALAYFLRDGLARIDALGLRPLEPFSEMLWTLPAAAILGPLFLRARGFYSQRSPRASHPPSSKYFATLVAAALTAFTLIVALFLLREQIARSVILLGCALGGAFACARAALAARLSATRLANEQWRERVLWLGDAASNARHRAALSPDETAHIKDCGDFDPDARTPAQLAALLHERAINTVIFGLGGSSGTGDPPVPDRVARATRPRETEDAQLPLPLNMAEPPMTPDPRDAMADFALRPFFDCCAREGVSVILRTGLHIAASPPALDTLGGETVLCYRAVPRAAPAELAFKRACDIALSLAALIVLSPVFLAVALAVKFTSRGPALFRQTRAGLNGRPFTMLKFRTMREGAENERPALDAQNEMRGPVFKIADDPRLTPPARFLRRHALDELPQFWNVLRGEMSIVGPRPLPDYETARFGDDAHRRRHSMRPGLTCIWQIKGRNDIIDFEEWVRMDLAYIDNWSPWLDAKIMLATVPAVFRGTGGR